MASRNGWNFTQRFLCENEAQHFHGCRTKKNNANPRQMNGPLRISHTVDMFPHLNWLERQRLYAFEQMDVTPKIKLIPSANLTDYDKLLKIYNIKG